MPRVSEDYYENKRREIIDAAYRVCIRKPIASVVMKDVIEETGFSHGVVYRYYKDLDDVLRDLVIKINRENNISGQMNEIINEADTRDWKQVITDICTLLADQMIGTGTDLLKISLYSNMMAMSDPNRVEKIAKQIDEDSQSPLLYLVAALSEYLTRTIKKEKLEPTHSTEDIIQFIIASYHGIETGYVLSESYSADQLQGKYKPHDMFACLADSVIAMLGG